jgi:hypothetical protein
VALAVCGRHAGGGLRCCNNFAGTNTGRGDRFRRAPDSAASNRFHIGTGLTSLAGNLMVTTVLVELPRCRRLANARWA